MGYVSGALGRFLGLLDNFERGLERAVNGAFAKTFRSGLQPVEVTSALRRELDTKAVVVARDRILVPNQFTVNLSPVDYDRCPPSVPSLIDEFILQVERHATAQRYSFAGGISIALKSDDKLAEGVVDIDSVSVKGAVAWTPMLEIDGTLHPLAGSRTIIGRGSEADITVDDTGISRKHVEVLWDGKRGQARDLGSTNGSKLNGLKLAKAPLEPRLPDRDRPNAHHLPRARTVRGHPEYDQHRIRERTTRVMSELTLLILRLAFLAVLWLFVFAVVYALRSDLFGQRLRRAGSDLSSPFAGAPVAVAAPMPVDPARRRRRGAHRSHRHACRGRPRGRHPTRHHLGPKEGLEIELPERATRHRPVQ